MLVYPPGDMGTIRVGHRAEDRVSAQCDILDGVDALVKAGIANPKQMAIDGYSYGGHMTNWLITQTDEFKAAVTSAGVVEHIGNWDNDDTTYDDSFFLGGLPWDAKARQNYIDEAAHFLLAGHRARSRFTPEPGDGKCPSPSVA